MTKQDFAKIEHYDLVFFSPHLDDVVISCAGKILSERAQGKTILVVTLFSRGDDTAARSHLYERRRAEDALAMERLGVDYLWLDFPDAPVRNVRYKTFESINMGRQDTDAPMQAQIEEAISSLLARVKAQQVFFPLAVGTHVDHLITHECYKNFSANAQIIFYEDRPYVYLNHNLWLRLEQLNATCPLTEKQRDLLPQPRLFKFFSLLKDMRKNAFYRRRLSRKTLLLTPWKLRQLFQLPSVAKSKCLLKPFVCVPRAEELGTIYNCIGAYQSQLVIICGTNNNDKHTNLQNWFTEAKNYAKRMDRNESYVERFWVATETGI